MSKTVETTREMKDSGIEWIGEIPSNWMLSKIGAQCKIFGRIGYRGYTVKDLVDKENGVITLGPSNIVNNKLDLSKQTYLSFEKYEESPEIKVYPGDIILVKTASVGKVAIIENTDEKLTLNPQLVVLKNIKCNNKFLYYLLASPVIEKQISDGIQNTVLSTITQAQIKKYCFPIPFLHEQQAIATYLDEQVGKMDCLILEQKQAIEKWKEYKQSLITESVTKGLNPDVKMKDSGIEWIGEIPKDWDAYPIKYVAELNPTYADLLEDSNAVSFAPMETLRTGSLKPYKALLSDVKGKYTPFKENDILMAKVTPCFENGNIAIATGLINGIGFGSSEFYVFRAKRCESSFLYYFLQNDIFKQEAVSTMYGTGGLKRVNSSFVKNYKMPLPPLREQQAIADYLDEKCEKINQTIEQKELLIKQLEEYKQSLIYECVTGKRRVL